MDGFEFVRQLRSDPAIAAIQVIFYSAAYHEYEARTLAKRCGVSHLLSKPSEPRIILQTVNEALGLPVAPPSPAPRAEDFDREHLRVLTDKLSQKIAELEAVSLRLRALIELGQAMASEYDPQRLVNLCCHEARKIIGASYSVIGLLDESGQSIRFFEMCGIPAGTHPSQTAVERVLLHRLLAERKPLRLHNPGGDPQALGFAPDLPQVYSVLGVLIVSPTRPYGWLGFRNKLGADEFTEDDEQLAVTIAAQMAVAYENIQRFDEIQRHASELEQRVQEHPAGPRPPNSELG
jgi:transcriptional regulator with GAF, ATPase, and Fis domain